MVFVNLVTKEFHKASINGDLEKVTNLLNRKEEINVNDLENTNTIHTAVQKGFTEIVKILIKIGINVNDIDCHGNTPLHLACHYSRNLTIVKILLENGANLDRRDYHDKTPLYRACENGHLETIQELLKHNPEIDAFSKDNRDSTPLQVAACFGNVKVVEELLKAGANIDHLDINKTTTLFLAVNGGHALIVKTLIDNGCKTNIRETNEELTEIELALDNASYGIFKMLASHEN